MRTRFERSGDYNLDLLEFDAVRVQHRPSGRITLIPFAQCRYVVLAAEEP
jgi:hypothetical protein